jgi:hypothetical protein
MEETLISFETAKLAKEKEFDEKVYREYDKSGYLRCTSKSSDVVLGPYEELLKSTEYAAPTQSLLQKWLRDEHNIHISVFCDYNIKDETFNTYWNINVINLSWGEDKEQYIEVAIRNYNKTYEEALEIGLQAALRL